METTIGGNINLNSDINDISDVNEINEVNNDNNNEYRINIISDNLSDISMHNNAVTTTTFKQNIIQQYIRPQIIKDIKSSMRSRYWWNIISIAIFFFSEIVVILSTIASFITSFYENKIISLVSGLLCVMVITLHGLGTYVRSLSVKNSNRLNKIFKKYNIDETVIDVSITKE